MSKVLVPVALFLLAACGEGAGGGSSASAAASGKPAGSAAAKPSATQTAAATATATASADAGGSDAIKKMLEDVQTNEGTYKDKPIKVDGLYLNTNGMTSGGKKTYNIVITDKKGDTESTLSCDLGAEEPKDLKQYDAVTIEGKGSVSNVTKGDKKMKSLSVVDCKVTKK